MSGARLRVLSLLIILFVDIGVRLAEDPLELICIFAHANNYAIPKPEGIEKRHASLRAPEEEYPVTDLRVLLAMVRE